MRIRSLTIGTNVSDSPVAGELSGLDVFSRRARSLFGEAGLEVQSVRLATQPFPEILRASGPGAATRLACQMEVLCRDLGIDYCSIGTVDATAADVDLAYVAAIPELIAATENVFATTLVAAPTTGIHPAAVDSAAQAIAAIARTTTDGFGNLRFAVLANCPPGSPFFPVAYHRGPGPVFAAAVEGADLAVEAFAQAGTLGEACERLRAVVESAGATIVSLSRQLEAEFGWPFGGIDFSLAPFPEDARSIGLALERLGVDRFGSSGTLFAVALVTRVLREARFPHCGFCGVMLPVLEDAVLARRSAEGLYTLDSLLLYSAVCGTGLDTIPLPGDVAVDELAAILLDVAALAVAADKPLTARLMPVPGKAAGEMTDFDLVFFANARILDVRGCGARRLLARK